MGCGWKTTGRLSNSRWYFVNLNANLGLMKLSDVSNPPTVNNTSFGLTISYKSVKTKCSKQKIDSTILWSLFCYLLPLYLVFNFNVNNYENIIEQYSDYPVCNIK